MRPSFNLLAALSFELFRHRHGLLFNFSSFIFTIALGCVATALPMWLYSLILAKLNEKFSRSFFFYYVFSIVTMLALFYGSLIIVGSVLFPRPFPEYSASFHPIIPTKLWIGVYPSEAPMLGAAFLIGSAGAIARKLMPR
jgi:hypothetical protein